MTRPPTSRCTGSAATASAASPPARRAATEPPTSPPRTSAAWRSTSASTSGSGRRRGTLTVVPAVAAQRRVQVGSPQQGRPDQPAHRHGTAPEQVSAEEVAPPDAPQFSASSKRRLQGNGGARVSVVLDGLRRRVAVDRVGRISPCRGATRTRMRRGSRRWNASRGGRRRQSSRGCAFCSCPGARRTRLLLCRQS